MDEANDYWREATWRRLIKELKSAHLAHSNELNRLMTRPETTGVHSLSQFTRFRFFPARHRPFGVSGPKQDNNKCFHSMPGEHSKLLPFVPYFALVARRRKRRKGGGARKSSVSAKLAGSDNLCASCECNQREKWSSSFCTDERRRRGEETQIAGSEDFKCRRVPNSYAPE